MAEMKTCLILLAFVAGCGASDKGNVAAGPSGKDAVASGPAASSPVADSAALTGLYEGGSTEAPSQLCVVEHRGEAHFGLVIWGAKLSACGGAGIIERDGKRLHFRMNGDQACTIDARIEKGTIRMEGPVPAGCSYYCGAHVGFEGVSLARKGSTVADAMKAKDPAGDPLCSS